VPFALTNPIFVKELILKSNQRVDAAFGYFLLSQVRPKFYSSAGGIGLILSPERRLHRYLARRFEWSTPERYPHHPQNHPHRV
jgi:hypothetical protein